MAEAEERDVLRRMRGQRRMHEAGDWFVLQLDSDATYRIGRIVKAGDATDDSRFPGGILAYVFEPVFEAIPASTPNVKVTQLLMPPFFTHKAMWSRGYFNTFANTLTEPDQILHQHCFYDSAADWYVDENDRPLDARYEPCGLFSLPSAWAFSEDLNDALHGRLAPVKQAQGRRSAADDRWCCAGSAGWSGVGDFAGETRASPDHDSPVTVVDSAPTRRGPESVIHG